MTGRKVCSIWQPSRYNESWNFVTKFQNFSFLSENLLFLKEIETIVFWRQVGGGQEIKTPIFGSQQEEKHQHLAIKVIQDQVRSKQ